VREKVAGCMISSRTLFALVGSEVIRSQHPSCGTQTFNFFHLVLVSVSAKDSKDMA